mmetsp:Transcript_18782/g.45033  ORF Transcript_18782/g.45033 Transcript_18782/m.45033 type:complete len:220 (+) Transcript_18782:853-1512(+)
MGSVLELPVAQRQRHSLVPRSRQTAHRGAVGRCRAGRAGVGAESPRHSADGVSRVLVDPVCQRQPTPTRASARHGVRPLHARALPRDVSDRVQPRSLRHDVLHHPLLPPRVLGRTQSLQTHLPRPQSAPRHRRRASRDAAGAYGSTHHRWCVRGVRCVFETWAVSRSALMAHLLHIRDPTDVYSRSILCRDRCCPIHPHILRTTPTTSQPPPPNRAMLT